MNDPYDVMGCWCTDSYFISGTMEWDYHTFNFDASIWLCSAPTLKTREKSNISNGLSEADGEKSIIQSNLDENTPNDMDCDITEKAYSTASGQNSICDSIPKSKDTNEHIVVSWYKKQLLKFRNLQVRYRFNVFIPI